MDYKCYKHPNIKANHLWAEGKQYLALCKECIKKLPPKNLVNYLLEINLLSDEALDKIDKLVLKG